MELMDVTVVVHKADDLVSTRKSQNHIFSVVMKMEKQKFRTKQIKLTTSPIWQEVSIFKSAKIKTNSVLKLVVTDKDEVIGQVAIPYSQIEFKPSEPTILQSPLMPHKKCRKPLGGTLFYEVWKSPGADPEVPRTRVITGDDYFAASERCSTPSLTRNQNSFKKDSLKDLFRASTLSHGISPSVQNLSIMPNKIEKWNKSCNDLSAWGGKNDKRSATLGGRLRSTFQKLGSNLTNSNDSDIEPSRSDVRRSPSISFDESSEMSIEIGRPHSRPNAERRLTSGSDAPDAGGTSRAASSPSARGTSPENFASPVNVERRTPDGSRHPAPAVSKTTAALASALNPFENGSSIAINKPNGSPNPFDEDSEKTAAEAKPRPLNPFEDGSLSSLENPAKMERIIQGSEDTSSKSSRENGVKGAWVCSACGGAKTKGAKGANFKNSPQVGPLLNEISDLRVQIHDLEEANEAMRSYLESLVGDVMEACPSILEKDWGSKAERKFERNQKYATVGDRRPSYNMAKKVGLGFPALPVKKPVTIISVPSLSKLFGKN